MSHKSSKPLDRLTNEEIAKKFDNQFELVLYAIKLAEEMIKTGRDPRVKTDIQNKALLVLQEILNGKDKLEDVTSYVVEDETQEENTDVA